jgi:fructosamine-3-kinase
MPPANAVIEAAGGKPVRRTGALSGGCISDVLLVEFADGSRAVAKLAQGPSTFLTEAWMLGYLKSHSALPVPAVLHAAENILLLEYLESAGALDARAQKHAADLLAALHEITAPDYGLERDTVIGSLHQPNARTKSWIEFFRDRRLMHMARAALDETAIDARLMSRIESLAARLDEFLLEPAKPSLIHGDMWGGNVLAKDGRITGFVDPAIYYADAEIELAFSTLFSTFGDPFFARYRELRGIRDGFFETRLDIYNLYPLLVHVRLFGGGYVGSVEATLARFGF